jgi:hypothetical protein
VVSQTHACRIGVVQRNRPRRVWWRARWRWPAAAAIVRPRVRIAGGRIAAEKHWREHYSHGDQEGQQPWKVDSADLLAVDRTTLARAVTGLEFLLDDPRSEDVRTLLARHLTFAR